MRNIDYEKLQIAKDLLHALVYSDIDLTSKEWAKVCVKNAEWLIELCTIPDHELFRVPEEEESEQTEQSD